MNRQAPRANAPKSAAIRIESSVEVAKGQPSPALKIEAAPVRSSPAPSKAGSTYPPYKISNVDFDAKPIFEPTGKPITEVDMDAGQLTTFPGFVTTTYQHLRFPRGR